MHATIAVLDDDLRDIAGSGQDEVRVVNAIRAPICYANGKWLERDCMQHFADSRFHISRIVGLNRASKRLDASFGERFHFESNISSICDLNNRAILKASGRLGSYFSVSMALMVCRETPSRSASSDCDHSFAARSSRSRFFICNAG